MPQLLANKKAHFNYDITDTYEAGVALLGFEVKSLKLRRGSLDGAYVVIRGGEAFITGMQIPPYQPNNTPTGYDPYRTRKLLLNKKEIEELLGAEQSPGHTIVPIEIYTKGPKVKLKIGIGRGKKKFDKRQDIKRRDMEREIGQKLK